MIHESYEDFIAGTPEQTNWPRLAGAPRRKDRVLYFIDANQETVGSATTLPLARKLATLLGGTVRRHVMTEESRVQEAMEHRQRCQAGDYVAY